MTSPNSGNNPQKSDAPKLAGGIFFPIFIPLGLITGYIIGQVSAGVIGGFVVACLAATALWFFDSRKKG